jgi:hypothetical protein
MEFKPQANNLDLPVGIAYVTDESVLEDVHLDFKKCKYVSIGISYDPAVGKNIIYYKTFS